MNKSPAPKAPRQPKQKQPKSIKKQPLQKQTKRSLTTSTISTTSNTTPRSTQSQLIYTQSAHAISSLASSAPLSSLQFTPQPLSALLFSKSIFTPKKPQQLPFALSTRKIILKPSKGLDPEVDLIFDFNILKEAQPIVELKDAEYPEWLWTCADTQKSLYDISKIPAEDMDIPTMRRKFKLDRRTLIRNNNTATRK